MITIPVKVKKRIITCKKAVVEDNVETYRVQLTLDEEWSDFEGSTRLVFYNDQIDDESKNPKDVLVTDSIVSIPWEVLSESGSLYLTLVGESGGRKIITKSMDSPIVVYRSGISEGSDPSTPTPSVIELIVATADEAKQIAQSVRDDADAGKFNGPKGDKGDPGTQGLQGVKGDTGESGLIELKASTLERWIKNLTNHLYYTVDDVRLRAHNTQKIYLELPQGTFLLVEKEVGSYGEIDLLRITIWGSCTFNNVEYRYGIHQYKYNTIGGLIENSFVLDTKSIETAIANLEANKQDNLTAGAGITITDNGVISGDVGLKMIVLGDGEELPPPYEGEENTIYFKRNTTEEESDDWYEEYVWVNDWWELIGTTKVDLSAYAQKSEVPKKTSELQNDSNFVVDEKYQHTDNNFTTNEKVKLASLSNYDDTGIVNELQHKQEKLTAGKNITINDDSTISAQCAVKEVTLSNNSSNPTLLTDIGAGAYVVNQTGYLKTTGGFTKLIGNGAELIIIRTNFEGVDQLCCTVQTGTTVLLIWDNMTEGVTNDILISTRSIKSDISQNLTNRQVLGALYTKELLEQKQDKFTLGTGLKLENNVLSLDIETATAQTAYGGES